MKSLKSKLILAISILVIVLLTTTSFLQVQEKQKELTFDIFSRGKSFAELTANKLIDSYKTYLIPKSFIYFNRDLQEVLGKDADVSSVQIVNFSGEILYDSIQEHDKQFEGDKRLIADQSLLQQIKSKNPSVKTLDTQKVIFLKKIDAENYQAVDFNENKIEALKKDERIQYFVQPASDEFAVVYGISYQALQDRINATVFRILVLAVFGIGLGILMAIILGGNITKHLNILRKGAEIFATGDFSHRVEVKTKDETFSLAQSFNKMAAELEISMKALVYKERVAKELELAAKIQKQLLPLHVPQVKGIDIAAGVIPAEEIGGDLYDFIQVDKSNTMFYLGDVTGHGVPSGIVVSIANALLYTFAGGKDLKSILIDVNKVLKEKTTSNMFLTLILMNWDAKNGKMTYVSAGHEQVIHYKKASNEVVLLPAGGMALGMLSDISKTLKVREVKLEKDDVLILYSDGIPEAWKNEKEMYGMERFKKVVKQYVSFPSAMAVRNSVMADVYMFRKGYKQMDDITSIVIKRT